MQVYSNSIEIFLQDIESGEEYSYDFLAVRGKYWRQDERQVYPARIPITRATDFSFPIEYCESAIGVDPNEDEVTDGGALEGINIKNFDYNHINIFNPNNDALEFHVEFYDPTYDCSKEWACLTWIGHSGIAKSWVFEVSKSETSGAVGFNLQTDDSQYNTKKSRKRDVTLRHERADYLTQVYLSDIVQSSEVEVYILSDYKTQKVNVSSSTFEILKTERDIEININFEQYGTY